MKITKQQLKRIIKEERKKLVNEAMDSAGNYIGPTDDDDFKERLFFTLLYAMGDLARDTAAKMGLTPSEVVDEIKYICKTEPVESILER
jgi:hypothetical protein